MSASPFGTSPRRAPGQSATLVGLRGVGKTVLLDHLQADAEAAGIHTVRIEVPESRSLPALLAPQLRQALLRLSQVEAAKAQAVRGLRAQAQSHVRRHRSRPGLGTEPGLADKGDLEHDLQALFKRVGLAAKSAGTALAVFIDELQYIVGLQNSLFGASGPMSRPLQAAMAM